MWTLLADGRPHTGRTSGELCKGQRAGTPPGASNSLKQMGHLGGGESMRPRSKAQGLKMRQREKQNGGQEGTTDHPVLPEHSGKSGCVTRSEHGAQ